MADIERIIQSVWHHKPNDTIPYTGWGRRSPTARAAPTRDDLLTVFAQAGFTEGAEIGVAEGRFSRQMLSKIPDLHLRCVDPWRAYGRVSQRICDERYQHAVGRLTPLGAEIMRLPSAEAAPLVPDGSLDFVFIDADHRFDAVMLDIILWSPKVKVGGIVSGHDYYHFYQSGVVEAVDAYVRAHGVHPWYVTREKETSWLWVKRG